MRGLSDVHAHLTHPTIAPRLLDVLDHARAAGVTSILSNGLHPADNEAVRRLAREHPEVRPCFGLYPVDAVMAGMVALGVDYPRDATVPSADDCVEWVRAHADEAFAIGEIGLDGYWVPEALWEEQERVFRELLRIAQRADKPVIIHTRKRERRTLEVLDELGMKRVNWHCFGGKVSLARQIAERGHTLSIPANARRHEAFTRMLETLPRTSVLLETDCPYLAPEPGGSSEPRDVRGTLAYAAERWGVTEDVVLEQLRANFERVFGAPP